MTYDPTVTTQPRNFVRLLIGDTGDLSGKVEVYNDDEIDLVLGVTGTAQDELYTAAWILLRGMHANKARFAVAFSVMQQEGSLDQRAVAREIRMAADAMKEMSDSLAVGDHVTWTDENLVELQDNLVRAGFLRLPADRR